MMNLRSDDEVSLQNYERFFDLQANRGKNVGTDQLTAHESVFRAGVPCRQKNTENVQASSLDHSRTNCKQVVFKFHKVNKASLNVESFLTHDGRSSFDRHLSLLTSEPHRYALEQMQNSIEHQIITNTIVETARLLEIRSALA